MIFIYCAFDNFIKKHYDVKKKLNIN
jgi:hypothetical protein